MNVDFVGCKMLSVLPCPWAQNAFAGDMNSQGPCSRHAVTCKLNPHLHSCSEQPATLKQGPLRNDSAITTPTKLQTALYQREQNTLINVRFFHKWSFFKTWVQNYGYVIQKVCHRTYQEKHFDNYRETSPDWGSPLSILGFSFIIKNKTEMGPVLSYVCGMFNGFPGVVIDYVTLGARWGTFTPLLFFILYYRFSKKTT